MGKNKRRKNHSRIRITKKKFTTFLIIVCIVGIVTYDFWARSKRDSIGQIPETRSMGSPDAALTIMEFVDFQCPECAKGAFLLKRYLHKYPDDIFLGIKYFPNEQQPHSIDSAVYAECAARQDKFWKFHDLLFKDQTYWRSLKDAKPYFRSMASKAGVEMSEFGRCVVSQDPSLVVKGEKANGEARFVQMTPTYFVNGEMVVGFEAIKKKLEVHFGG